VPPTLVSFAVAPGDSGDVISPEFKAAGHTLCLLRADAFDAETIKANLARLYEAIKAGKVLSAWALGLGGVAEAAFKMALGNRIGAKLENMADPFRQDFGAVLLEMADGETLGDVVGCTIDEYAIAYGDETVKLDALQEVYESKLSKVFPYYAEGETVSAPTTAVTSWAKPTVLHNKPVAFIPAFPGTNCEIDTARALTRAGAEPRVLLINNLVSDFRGSIIGFLIPIACIPFYFYFKKKNAKDNTPLVDYDPADDNK